MGPYYELRRPPPKSSHLLILLAVFFALAIAIPVVLFATPSGPVTNPPSKPFVTFSVPTVTAFSVSFTVAAASPSVSITSYKFNLEVNGVYGSAQALSAGNHTIGLSGFLFYVEYVDVAGNGNLKPGDVIRIGNASGGGLPTGTYSFLLLWSADGSTVQAVAWAL